MLVRIITSLLSAYLNCLAMIAPKMAGKQAFFVFCYPFATKLRGHQRAFLDTADQRDFSFEGKKLKLYTWGKGPEKVLCIHGWQSNSFRWKKFVERFDKERYTLVAFDAPGHGATEGRILNVPIYGRAIRAVAKDLDGVDHILCHSIGGFAMLYACHDLALQQPKSMSLLAPPGNAQEFFDYFLALLKISPRLEKSLRVYFKEYTGHEVDYYQLTRFATAVQCPVLLVHDRDDKDTSYKHSERLHDILQQSNLVLTAGLGHKLRDKSVVEEVMSFFEQHQVEPEPLVSVKR